MIKEDDFYYTETAANGDRVHIFQIAGHQCILMHRKNYRGYSETPTKGFAVNPRIAKKLVRLAAGAIFSSLIGYAYKAGKMADDLVVDYYDAKIEEEKQPKL
ncbi:hypothetical protein SEA_CRICKO_50 [Streptomyces phage CricKo]|nr:hypothetical protein SEA_RAINYDAI_48 [Streptomyces phage Rainydai]AWN06149.1 hypothetical protein SEA_SENDITCS_46 [Streptomyces phage SendItCS]QJD49933.1 hypothetical protein SEA_CRICKO_50 [Streptomyces phage CricKo]QNL30665.1 hypothetical protein SEA_THIQQUMS_50 [Streptomyces phage Thiqqums]WIC89384.1 membrane protein [Streptomyces phage Miek]